MTFLTDRRQYDIFSPAICHSKLFVFIFVNAYKVEGMIGFASIDQLLSYLYNNNSYIRANCIKLISDLFVNVQNKDNVTIDPKLTPIIDLFPQILNNIDSDIECQAAITLLSCIIEYFVRNSSDEKPSSSSSSSISDVPVSKFIKSILEYISKSETKNNYKNVYYGLQLLTIIANSNYQHYLVSSYKTIEEIIFHFLNSCEIPLIESHVPLFAQLFDCIYNESNRWVSLWTRICNDLKILLIQGGLLHTQKGVSSHTITTDNNNSELKLRDCLIETQGLERALVYKQLFCGRCVLIQAMLSTSTDSSIASKVDITLFHSVASSLYSSFSSMSSESSQEMLMRSNQHNSFLLFDHKLIVLRVMTSAILDTTRLFFLSASLTSIGKTLLHSMAPVLRYNTRDEVRTSIIKCFVTAASRGITLPIIIEEASSGLYEAVIVLTTKPTVLTDSSSKTKRAYNQSTSYDSRGICNLSQQEVYDASRDFQEFGLLCSVLISTCQELISAKVILMIESAVGCGLLCLCKGIVEDSMVSTHMTSGLERLRISSKLQMSLFQISRKECQVLRNGKLSSNIGLMKRVCTHFLSFPNDLRDEAIAALSECSLLLQPSLMPGPIRSKIILRMRQDKAHEDYISSSTSRNCDKYHDKLIDSYDHDDGEEIGSKERKRQFEDTSASSSSSVESMKGNKKDKMDHKPVIKPQTAFDLSSRISNEIIIEKDGGNNMDCDDMIPEIMMDDPDE